MPGPPLIAITFRSMRRWYADIRSWLLIVLLIRLIGITSAPLENTHSWRQAFTNMVARNMAEGPFDLLHPRTDLAGERIDIVASEFPGFNALIAIVARVLGPAHWYGRMIALILSTLGVWGFHALVRRRYDAHVAFNASFVLLWSSWFLYGRKAMPDTISIALVLIALYFVDRALHRRDPKWILLAVPLAAFGGLCKIPAIVLFAAWGLMLAERSLPLRWRVGGLLALVLATTPVIWWYFHWQPHLLTEYGNQLYFPVSLREGFVELKPYGGKLLERFAFSALLSHVAFGFLLVGLWRVHRTRDLKTALLIIGIFFPFGIFLLKTGSVFPLHAYYVLPMVPLMALLVGVGLGSFPAGRWTVLALTLIAIEGMGIRWNDLNGTNDRVHLLRAEELADRFSERNDLVACTGGIDPRTMYFLHRHGWSLGPSDMGSATVMDSLRSLGLKLICVDRHTMNEPLPFNLLYEDLDWRIYEPIDRISDGALNAATVHSIP